MKTIRTTSSQNATRISEALAIAGMAVSIRFDGKRYFLTAIII